MTTVTIEEAQANLSEIIQQLQPGEEVTIIDHGKPLAQMKKTERTLWSSQPQTAASTRPGPGLCQGVIVYMAPDFDAPLEDALLFLYQKVLQVQLPWLNDGWVKRSRLG